MRRMRLNSFLRKCGGVFVAVAGIALVVNTLPLYLWPLFLGFLLIWMGWRLYMVNHF
ncbi:MAG: hypothetical protein GX996_09850 [Firmicutes bacterium]|nr:hypothetical protein [Bacillota bacterium]